MATPTSLAFGRGANRSRPPGKRFAHFAGLDHWTSMEV
jgi:hypothetical protein